MNSINLLSILLVCSPLAAASCGTILGLEPGEKRADGGRGGADGGGGSGGQAASGGADGGGPTCEPGASDPCYDGPAETEGVGVCKAGARTCKDDGRGFGPCEGEVTPAVEACKEALGTDENCNGYRCSEAIWGHSFGDAGYQLGEQVAADADRNVVLIGSFEGSVDFGGGARTSAGLKDVFVAKYRPDGGHLWSKRFGSAENQLGNGVAVDPDGGVLLTGSFDGAIDFGGGLMLSSGQNDVFIAKLSPAGDLLWQKRLGDGLKQDGKAVAAGADGDVLACGSFLGAMDFGAGAVISAGDYDAYVVSFDRDGKLRWSARLGDAAAQYCEGLAAAADGSVTITGSFKGTVTFGGQTLTSVSDLDSYVATLDKDGSPLWAVALAGPGAQQARSVAIGPDGGPVVAGYMSGVMNAGGATLSNAGAADAFVVKLSSKGDYVWGHSYGDAGNQFADDVAVDAQGDVFVAGYFGGKIDLGGGLLGAVGAGTDDMFVAKLERAAGEHVWSRRLGDVMDQYARSVAVSPAGDLYVSGHINGAVDLGGGIVKSQGNFDVFLARLEP